MLWLDEDCAEVCLLDDDLAVLKGMSRLLSCSGWQAKSFSDPTAFLRYADACAPRVAVIDVAMPRMNGLEVQSRLCEVSPATRVIFLTGQDDPAVRSQAVAAGASAFFLKGEPTEGLLAEIQAAVPYSWGGLTWETIADNLHDAGFSLGCVDTVDREGRVIWIVDAHGYGKRFVVQPEEIVTAFPELKRAIHELAVILML
jgi:DNA-binding response OmpR family regulator